MALAYGYDALWRRRSRSVNGARTDFLLSGDQEVGEYAASGALLRRFLWGPAGPDDIVAPMGATGGVAARRRFHHLDGLGSTVALTDSTGAVVERYPATAFGVGDSNAGITPWRFTGRRLDPDTGFYHLRARDYAPMLGRFVQPDPIGMVGGVNLYAYVGNDPLDRTDPSGLVPLAVLAPYLVGGALGGASGAFGGYLQGGLRGALAGFAVGAAAGAAAPFAAQGVGILAGQGALGVAARVGAFTGVNFGGGFAGTYAAGRAGGNAASVEDMLRGGAISALAPLSGEAQIIGAAGRGLVAGRAGETPLGVYSNVVSSVAGFLDNRLRANPAAPAAQAIPVSTAAPDLPGASSPAPMAASNPPGSSLYIGAALRK